MAQQLFSLDAKLPAPVKMALEDETSMNVTIRKARNSEAEELTQLARRAKASWGYPEAWLREWETHLKFSSDYIDNHSVS